MYDGVLCDAMMNCTDLLSIGQLNQVNTRKKYHPVATGETNMEQMGHTP